MFDSLDEQIKADENKTTTSAERMVRWAVIVLVSVIVFGGVILGVHFMQS
jgi:hypothetical protein